MSEVKRYDCTNGKAQHCYGCYQMDEVEYGSWVQASDFDAERLRAETALSEVAALREELAGMKETLALFESEFSKQSDSLTAAEQRNASLKVMLEAVRMSSKELLMAWVPTDWETRRALLLASDEPTESGASE